MIYNDNNGKGIKLTRCTISGNSTSNGGTIHNLSSTGSIVMTDCTLSNNTGVTIYCASGLVVLTGCGKLEEKDIVQGDNATVTISP